MEMFGVGLIGLSLMLFFGFGARLFFGSVISLENIKRKLVVIILSFSLFEMIIVLFSYWLLKNGQLNSEDEFTQIIVYLSMGIGFISIFWYSYKNREKIYAVQREADSEEEIDDNNNKDEKK